MKGNISKALLCFDEENLNDDGRLAAAKELYNTYHNRENGRIKVDIALHAIYTSNRKYLARVAEETASLDGVRHIHLSETKKENEDCMARYQKTPARVFYESGFFNKPTLAAHCVHLTPEDRELLRECAVSVAPNPTSTASWEAALRYGALFWTQGVNVALAPTACASKTI